MTYKSHELKIFTKSYHIFRRRSKTVNTYSKLQSWNFKWRISTEILGIFMEKSITSNLVPLASQSTQYLLSSSRSKAFNTDWHLSWSCFALSFSPRVVIFTCTVFAKPYFKSGFVARGGCHYKRHSLLCAGQLFIRFYCFGDTCR